MTISGRVLNKAVHFPLLNKDLKFNLSGEWATKARQFADEVLAPKAAAIDQQSRFPEQELAALASQGFFTLRLPTSSGGANLSAVEYAEVMRELSAACASTSVAVSVTNMVAMTLDKTMQPSLAETVRPHFAANDNYLLSFAITEPESGSDARSIKTSYRKTDEGFVIKGHKCFITSGTHASGFVTTARSTDNPDLISTFFVPAGTSGLRTGKAEKKMGLLGSTTVQLFYEDVTVPKDHLLSEEGAGFKTAMHALNSGRISIACQALGILGATLRDTHAWLEKNGGQQGKRWQLVDMATALEAGMMMIFHASNLADQGKEYKDAASRAKLFCTEEAVRMVQLAAEITGLDGLTNRTSIERHMRDCRVTTLYEGTSEIQRLVIARGLIKSGFEATL